MITWLKIGGVVMPSPVTYKVSLQDLDSENTTRDELGVMHRDRIRPGVYKIALSFRVKVSDLQTIVSAITPKSFSVEFWDMCTFSYITATMYCGDREATVVKTDNVNENQTYCDFSFDLIQF